MEVKAKRVRHTATRLLPKTPHCMPKARVASRSGTLAEAGSVHTPERRTTRAVTVHTRMVSTKTSMMP